LQKNLKLVTDFTKKVIAERREDFAMDTDSSERTHNKNAFLDTLLSMEKEGDLTDNDIRDEVGKFLF
jgi:cytochrome P450